MDLYNYIGFHYLNRYIYCHMLYHNLHLQVNFHFILRNLNNQLNYNYCHYQIGILNHRMNNNSNLFNCFFVNNFNSQDLYHQLLNNILKSYCNIIGC